MMLHQMCSDYSCLPGPGGLLNQDSYIVYGLQAISMAVAEREKKEQDKHGPRFSPGPSVRRR